MRSRCAALTLVVGTLLPPGTAAGQGDPILPEVRSRDVALKVDSGAVWARGRGDEAEVVWATLVEVPGAPWLQLHFGATSLAGDLEVLRGSRLRITSMADGAVQYFDAHSLALYRNTSVYFNGDAAAVEVLAYPGAGRSRVRIEAVTAGEPAVGDSICGTTDDRLLSGDPRSARLMTIGCSSWLFSDRNNQFGTAGHCIGGNTVQFNVPLSGPTGTPIAPGPEDQYTVDSTSKQSQSGSIGNDWGYFGVFPNSNTGLMPVQRQQQFYVLAPSAPPVSGQTIRITGYGTTSSGVPREWNQAQKTHTGPYAAHTGTTIQYAVDTTGGNSGSPVINESDGQRVIGVHTHAGCTQTGGANNGTAAEHGGWRSALLQPRGVCNFGNATPAGPVYATDLINKFGTVSTASGVFGNFPGHLPPGIQGLAFDRDHGVFWACDNARKLHRVTPTGAVTEAATITGAALINALAFDPRSDTLYGMQESNGQLYRIDTASGAATPVGAPGGGSVGGMDFDPVRSLIWAVDDQPGGTRLVTINHTTGARTLVGPIGANITDTDGLAYHEESDTLYTINDANDTAYRISTGSGAASVLGATGSQFGPVYGMAAGSMRCTANWDNAGGLDLFDFLAYQNDFATSLPKADMDGNGVLDILDFLAYQNAYAEGCP